MLGKFWDKTKLIFYIFCPPVQKRSRTTVDQRCLTQLHQQAKNTLLRNRLQRFLFLVSIARTTSMNMSVESNIQYCIFFAKQIKKKGQPMLFKFFP